MDARTGFIVMFCFIGFTYEKMVKFKTCTYSGEVYSVDVVPCNSEPCRLPRGHNYTVCVKFTSPFYSRTSKTVVHGVIVGVAIPWPIPQENGCKSGIRCPIKKKKTYTYVGTLTVKPEYPLTNLNVRWELRDDDYEDFLRHVPSSNCEVIEQLQTSGGF